MQSFFLYSILTLISIAYSQPTQHNSFPGFDYEMKWKEVQNLEERQLPKSAFKVVEEIYQQASKENNSPQLVKAVVHILKFKEYEDGDAYVRNLNRLEDEVEKASFPAKPILRSMLAEVYWSYYENNRYRFSQRTNTVDFDNKDISTWSLEKIVSETIANYQLSIQEQEKLKEIKIDDFEEILLEGNKMGRERRPTLYDFLAHRALDFFANQEADIVKPAYAFVINDPAYLNDASEFVTLTITSEDSLSHHFHALKIYQDLIEFHLEDSKKEALFDVDLKRILFVSQHLTSGGKEELYLKALVQLEEDYSDLPLSTLATYHIAQIWNQRANLYQSTQSDDHQWDRKKAFDICQKAIDKFPDSEGAAMAENLQNEIQMKSVAAQMEKINVPNQPFRAFIQYRNFSKLHWRAIKVDRMEVAEVRDKWRRNYNVNQEQKFLEHFLAKSAEKQGSYELPDLKDYQQHSVEVKIDPLTVGDYLIVYSANEDFSFEENAFSYSFTSITNLSYVHRNRNNGSTDLYVLDRSTGAPLANARVAIFFQTYNNRRSEYEWRSGGDFLADREGYISIDNQAGSESDYYRSRFAVVISFGNDQLDSRSIDPNYAYYQGMVNQYKNREPKAVDQTIFFLDRAIYRPGQTVFFKGLMYASNGKDPKILARRKTTVTFYDVNHQEVARQDLVTNEFGTFNGTFTTPTSGLTGQMFLQVNDERSSRQYFRVEEYKRPKFEVLMEPVKGTFKLGDSINATGVAKAYSGANIDGASVTYRVVRQARFPFWWWCWRGYYPSSPEMEITNGTAETDAEGKFSVDFKAIPDESVDPASSPTFDFVVYADVTDINGETHSGQQTISVGYQSLLVGVEVSDLDKSNADDLKKPLQINTTNLSGQFEPAKGTIQIWKLESPVKVYRSRYWSQPDQYIYSEPEFHAHFPNDPYKDESNFYTWEKEREVLSVPFNTAEKKEMELKNLKSWKEGKYMLEVKSQDKDGKEVKEVAYFDVTDSKSKALTYPEMQVFVNKTLTREPGEKAQFRIGSYAKVYGLFEVEHDGELLMKKVINLENELEDHDFMIAESHRGNIVANYTFIRDSRMYTQSQTVTVPYSNKELNIRFETFRDKLQPGEKEQWRINISGKKADEIMAEMVATLYDESLDVFASNSWYAHFYPTFSGKLGWSNQFDFSSESFRYLDFGWNNYGYHSYDSPSYDHLNWFGLNLYNLFYWKALAGRAQGVNVMSRGRSATESNFMLAESVPMEDSAELEEIVVTGYSTQRKSKKSEGFADLDADANEPAPEENSQQAKPDFSDVKIRSNFNETAFFYPDLKTNEKGEIIINFTVPEALTRWKMLGFAHTQDLKYGTTTNHLVTQKDLMVVPNQPRFFRENDEMFFSAKITSLAEQELKGEARLEFFDALTMKPVDALLGNTNNVKVFQLEAKKSTSLDWFIKIPEDIQAITYRIVAKAGNFSDGEEMVIPVVTNRMLVTETLPLPIRGNQTKEFTFEKLKNNSSNTLKSHRYTLEFTSNPAWYAVQALPYLMEYPYECTEQTFSRFYANSIASHVANSNPKIKRVFDTWATIQPDALLSNLEKNQELKSALLEETPWVLQAKDESQRKRRIALLFDLNRMANEQEKALEKIKKAQSGNGGFSWFPGFPEDRYMTQHIVTGLGHLDVMGVKSVRDENDTWNMVANAVRYMDREMDDHYKYLKSQEKKGLLKLKEYQPNYSDIQYLYARSYFKDIALNKGYEEAHAFFLEQCRKYWTKQSIYMQGMIALALHRYDEKVVTGEIIKSLNEKAIHSEEMGMSWKYTSGYYWYQAPIETQALMIEVYDEVAKDQKAVEELKVWLLKQKQTQDWKTTKATTEAVYALLRRGTDLLANDELAQITIGNKVIDPAKLEGTEVEAGTGYFKTSWDGSEITPEMGSIKVSKKNEGVAWGAVYWQYFEQLDKITPAETPLLLKKQLFLQKNTDRGSVITPINENTSLAVGDLVKVRIEIRVDRAMEYVHLKDMRAAGFEPVETLSRYKYQDGLHYYESPRDLATNFFMGWLPKGTYVFEYPLRVSQRGNFSNGITTIQCMYAPEFSSHSEGVRVKVER